MPDPISFRSYAYPCLKCLPCTFTWPFSSFRTYIVIAHELNSLRSLTAWHDEQPEDHEARGRRPDAGGSGEQGREDRGRRPQRAWGRRFHHGRRSSPRNLQSRALALFLPSAISPSDIDLGGSLERVRVGKWKGGRDESSPPFFVHAHSVRRLVASETTIIG